MYAGPIISVIVRMLIFQETEFYFKIKWKKKECTFGVRVERERNNFCIFYNQKDPNSPLPFDGITPLNRTVRYTPTPLIIPIPVFQLINWTDHFIGPHRKIVKYLRLFHGRYSMGLREWSVVSKWKKRSKRVTRKRFSPHFSTSPPLSTIRYVRRSCMIERGWWEMRSPCVLFCVGESPWQLSKYLRDERGL